METGDDRKIRVSEVLVHGAREKDVVLRFLQDIQRVSQDAAARTSQAKRSFSSQDEFMELLKRVQSHKAKPVLRKVFLWQPGTCNVMQEVWIEDKLNPLAVSSPLKQYAIVHLHYHASVASVKECKLEHLEMVDAINVRHLALSGKGYQKDNPFFDTFIEPSGFNEGNPPLLVFPAADWICSACKVSNFPYKLRCRGKKKAQCDQLQPCVKWNWQNNKEEREAGIAELLKRAMDLVPWPSGGKKTIHRCSKTSSPGLDHQETTEMIAVYELKELLSDFQARMGSVSNINVPGHVKGVTVLGEELACCCCSEGGSECSKPTAVPSRFTMLFVGANNVKGMQLNLEEELRSMRSAFWEEYGCSGWEATFHHWCFATVEDLIGELMIQKPTVLHLACHGQRDGLRFLQSRADTDLLVQAIRSINSETNTTRKLRVAIVNSCLSSNLARELSSCVNIVVGHETEVEDSAAIRFTRLLYRGLGRGESFLKSFTMARVASRSYHLYSPTVDPEQLVFPRRQRQAIKVNVDEEDAWVFQARPRVLNELRRWLANEEPPHRMLLHGLGGGGKTTLGRMFVAEASLEVVLWVSANDYQKSYTEIAEKLTSEGQHVPAGMDDEELRGYVHGLLRGDKWKRRWVVVLDDCGDPAETWISNEFPFNSGKTLVTSRWAAWSECGGSVRWCEMDVSSGAWSMSMEEACMWMKKRVKSWSSPEHEEGVREVVRKLECFPLAVEQAAAFADKYKHVINSPAKYLEEQSKTSSKLLKMWQEGRFATGTGQYPFSFVEVMQQTFERLATSDAGALELLRKMSFLHPDGIYRDIFDDDEWAHLCTLKEHSLIVDRGVSFEEVSMHAMTQAVVREHLMGGSRRTALGGVLESLNNKMCGFDDDKPDTWDIGRRYGRHVTAVASHTQQGAEEKKVLQARLVILFLCSDFGTWCLFIRSSRKRWRAIIFLGGLVYNALGLYRIWRWWLSRKLSEKGMAVLANVYYKTALFYDGVAASFSTSLALHEKSLDIKIKLHSGDHPDVAASYSGMGDVNYKQGKLDEALRLYKKSLAIKMKLLGEDHPDVAEMYNNMAVVVDTQGRLDEALVLHEKSLAIRLKVHGGEEHPDVAESYNNMAIVYDTQGKLEKALELHEKSLSIIIKVHGEEHPDVVASYNNMALVFKEQGMLEKALELHQKSLDIGLKVLGEEHPHVLTSYNNMAVLYHMLGRLEESLELHEKSLTSRLNLLGEEHNDVAASYNNMAGVLKQQGKLDESLKLYQKSLAIRLKVLGEQHPDVATLYRNIAVVYKVQDRLEDSLEHFKKSLAIRLKVFGEQHSDVATLYDNMADLYEQQGKLDECRDLRLKVQAVKE